MKHLYLLAILMFATLKLFAQCSFKEYEKYIEQNCFNCAISQEDSLVQKNIFLSNSKLTKIHKDFYYKLKNEYNGTVYDKKVLSMKYEKVYKDLKKSRSEVLLFYRFMAKNSNSKSSELITYWFYTDKIIAILLDVQESLFGDV